MTRCAIVIPARYGSTRLPGKPLRLIRGRPLLERVCWAAKAVRGGSVPVYVATDDRRIATAAESYGVAAVMTPAACASGTDRVHAALQTIDDAIEYCVNMQGDAPFTRPDSVEFLFDCLERGTSDVVTAVRRLSWTEADALRQEKTVTPFSGTTAIVTASGRALWFSKAMLPALRNEAAARASDPMSPYLKHVGLYGYTRAALARFVATSPSPYEVMEGLEQLRFLELGMTIHALQLPRRDYEFSVGVDSIEDVERVEKMIAEHGEPEWMPRAHAS